MSHTYDDNRQLDSRIGADDTLYDPGNKARTERLMKMLNAYWEKYPLRERWLDVGSGESYMRDVLRDRTGLKIEVSEADLDVDRYDYPDNSFHTLTHFEVLEHLFNPLFHVLEMKRIMAPGANLFLVTPNDYSLIYKVEHILSRKYRPHFHQFNERDLRDLFQRAGLKIVHLQTFYKSPTGTIARISQNGFFLHAQKA
ncbi:MAG: methyltransferase domain-containing protein [bacterium]|nr:methyltransferase domain-containing protein [bacterium]